MKHNTECDLRLRPTASTNIPHSRIFAKVYRECAQDAAREMVGVETLYDKACIATNIQRSGQRFALLVKQYVREMQLSRNFAEVWKS